MFCKFCGKKVFSRKIGDDHTICEGCNTHNSWEALTTPSYCSRCGTKLKKLFEGTFFCENCQYKKEMIPHVSVSSMIIHYLQFLTFYTGRTSRRQFIIIFSITMYFISFIFVMGLINSMYIWLFSLPALIVLFIGAIRRLHDTNRSGWELLWCLSGLGIAIITYWLFQAGDTKTNKYGVYTPEIKMHKNPIRAKKDYWTLDEDELDMREAEENEFM